MPVIFVAGAGAQQLAVSWGGAGDCDISAGKKWDAPGGYAHRGDDHGTGGDGGVWWDKGKYQFEGAGDGICPDDRNGVRK